MELMIGIAIVAAVAWWWLRHRRRAPARKAAELRERMGYSASGSGVSEQTSLERYDAEQARLDRWFQSQGGRSPRSGSAGAPSIAAPSKVSAPDWSRWLDRPDVLIIDTETTGLGDRAEVIEVAVLDTTGAVRYEALSLPVGRIPSAASDIHGLTRPKLKAAGARPWPEVHGELATVLDGAVVALAWNADFDRRLLAQTADRHGLTLPRLTWHDLIEEYRAMTGEGRRKGRHNLAAVVRRTGATVDGPAHRAASDCRAVLAVMRAVVESKGAAPAAPGRRGRTNKRQRTRQPAADAGEAPLRPAVVPLDDPAPPIVFQGRRFVFTGDFAIGDRSEHEQAVIDRGGEVARNVSKRVAYVVIGEHGSADWKHGTFGTKVERAVHLRDEGGASIAIVTERHWRAALD